jgi:chemotaxis protein CheZ
MGSANRQHLDRIVGDLKEKRAEDIALAELTAESLQTLFASLDTAIYRELRDIAAYINDMKVEIGALQENALKESRSPATGQELGAIVKATEAATHTIMECAEIVMAADASEPAAYKALVDQQMMAVFEACSFQDITGQRTARVVETLQQIEQRIARFVDAIRAKDLSAVIDGHERNRAERKSKFMLNGPARDGEGIGQAQVDQLFA